MRTSLSLKQRALRWLAQRDRSRVELRGKLLRHVTPAAGEGASPQEKGQASGADVEALLDWLEAHRYLSAERFAESRVHAREARFGNLRIKSELAQHGVALSQEVARELAESELRRASAVCTRRFPSPSRDPAGRAAEARFLTARGFSPDVIRRLMRERRAVAPAGESVPRGHAESEPGEHA
jgi:regulatory protein